MGIVGNALIIGINPKKMLPEISSYSGTYDLKSEKLSNGDYNWELAILSGSNTNLKFSKIAGKVDIFLVGGGANGGSGSAYDQSIYGGSGGKGGQCITASNVTLKPNVNYAITIGGAGAATSMSGNDFTTLSASGGSGVGSGTGTGTNGGTGASMPSIVYPTQGSNATSGSNGSYAFGSSTSLFQSGRRYGAGGGAGGVYRISNNGNNYSFNSSSGGLTGGGTGGSASANEVKGGNASANTGSGGGGGNARIIRNTYGSATGGSGGSGIIIIRNHR